MLCIIGLLFQGRAVASLPDYASGVSDEYTYNEMVFVTGAPMLFTGTIKVTEKTGDPLSTKDYKFKLTCNTTNSAGKAVIAKLDRTMTYETTVDKYADKGQTIQKTTIKKFKETITVDKLKYDLVDFQFSRSDVVDNRPASNFINGNFEGKKVFTINKTQGYLTESFSGGVVAYSNFWGNTETGNANYLYESDRLVPAAAGSTQGAIQVTWDGTVTTKGSDSLTRELQYRGNDAKFASFEGGYIKTTNSGMVSELSFDMPRFQANGSVASRRNIDDKKMEATNMPKVERLIVPKLRDIGGHWAEDGIKKLYSLNVFDDTESFFAPDIPMTRMQFVKSLMNACNIKVEEPVKKRATISRKKVIEQSIFSDVAIDDPNYKVAKDAVAKGIVAVDSANRLKPNEPITKMEATIMLIRALGFENRAPSPGFSTQFTDDAQIPQWAKDSAYMAYETDLVAPDNAGQFNPNKKLTRAEASEMLVKFLDFLEKELQKDYQNRTINYNS